jgi:hypothetical protein
MLKNSFIISLDTSISDAASEAQSYPPWRAQG